MSSLQLSDAPVCFICGQRFKRALPALSDWEYGVEFHSQLVECDGCGLVTHHPQVRAEQIAGLYPKNYLAHSVQSAGTSIYGRLKQVLRMHSARKIARRVPTGGTFLEIGCGNCQLIRDLRSSRPDLKLAGVDIEQVQGEPIEQFTFYHGQLEQVDIPAASVDLIYCSNLIEHVADPRGFLEICARILKPGGTLYGVTPNHSSLDRFIFRKYWAGYHYPRHTFLFNHRNLRDLFEQLRFERINITGSYSFWYLSLANRFVTLPGTKKRGLLFAATTAAFLPLDLLLNLITTHGSMTFEATAPQT